MIEEGIKEGIKNKAIDVAIKQLSM